MAMMLIAKSTRMQLRGRRNTRDVPRPADHRSGAHAGVPAAVCPTAETVEQNNHDRLNVTI
jgi:hypothetical protein